MSTYSTLEWLGGRAKRKTLNYIQETDTLTINTLAKILGEALGPISLSYLPQNGSLQTKHRLQQKQTCPNLI